MLLIAATLVTPVAVGALWLRLSLLDQGRYVHTVAPLASNQAIVSAVAGQVTDTLLDQVDASSLEGELGKLGPFLAAGVHGYVTDLVEKAPPHPAVPGAVAAGDGAEPRGARGGARGARERADPARRERRGEPRERGGRRSGLARGDRAPRLRPRAAAARPGAVHDRPAGGAAACAPCGQRARGRSRSCSLRSRSRSSGSRSPSLATGGGPSCRRASRSRWPASPGSCCRRRRPLVLPALRRRDRRAARGGEQPSTTRSCATCVAPTRSSCAAGLAAVVAAPAGGALAGGGQAPLAHAPRSRRCGRCRSRRERHASAGSPANQGTLRTVAVAAGLLFLITSGPLGWTLLLEVAARGGGRPRRDRGARAARR